MEHIDSLPSCPRRIVDDPDQRKPSPNHDDPPSNLAQSHPQQADERPHHDDLCPEPPFDTLGV